VWREVHFTGGFMKSNSLIMKVGLITLASCSFVFADLVSVNPQDGNAAADALSRISAAQQFEGVNTAALDPGTDLQENYVYYSDLNWSSGTGNVLGGVVSGGGGGGSSGGGGGTTTGGDPYLPPSTDPGAIVDGPAPVPTPGAAILAMIGMSCVGYVRRRF
jgi:uncharacterized membrane protein YgcG